MQVRFREIFHNYSYSYDSRTTSAYIDNASTSTNIVISTPPQEVWDGGSDGDWDGKDFIVISSTSNVSGFGSLVSDVNYARMEITLDSATPSVPDDGSEFKIVDLGESPAVTIFNSSLTDSQVLASCSTTGKVCISYPPDEVTSSEWSTYSIQFTSGNLSPNSYQIASTSYTLMNVVLTEPLPNAPADGEFVVVSKSSTTFGSPRNLFGSPDSVAFGTHIASGYAEASVSFPVSSRVASASYDEAVGSFVEIYDSWNEKVWEGRVSGVSVGESGVSIDALGISDTFNDFVYSTLWTATQGPGGVTTPVDVVKDIIAQSDYVQNKVHDVDGDGSIRTAQAALGGFPFDFTDTPTRAREALDEVLRVGDGSNNFNRMFLQVWNNRMPKLVVANSSPVLNDSDWIIDELSISVDARNLSHELSMENLGSKVSSVFTDFATGEQVQGAYKYDLDALFRFGRREIVRSDGNIDSGNAIGLSGVVLSAVSDVLSTTDISLSGRVVRQNTSVRHPVYMIKAGDVVSAPVMVHVFGGAGVMAVGETTFVVEKTTYNNDSGEMKIEPSGSQSRIDVFLAQIIG